MFRTNNMEFPACQAFLVLKLPTVVLLQVIEYLNKKERGILSRVNRQFREIMNSPSLWTDTTFVLTPNKLDHCGYIVNLLAPRKVQSVILASSSTRRKDIQQFILRGIPSLRDIDVSYPCSFTLDLIARHAKGITTLHLGMVSEAKTPNLTLHFKELENLMDVSLRRDKSNFQKDFNEEIKNALCYHGNLRCLGLHYFYIEDLQWIAEVVQQNPNLETLVFSSLTLRNVNSYGDPFKEGIFDKGFAKFKQNSTLKTLVLWDSMKSVVWMDLYSSLVSLHLNSNQNEHLMRQLMINLYKLPNLKNLFLEKTALKNDMFLENHPKLCSLELKNSFAISGRALRTLSSTMGITLIYLGLSSCCAVRDADLIPLTTMFPCLDTIDLSGSTEGISDRILHQDLYNAKLRKIILKHSPNISKEAVQMVRKKSRNRMIVIF